MSFERDNIHRMAGYTSGEQPDDDQTIKLNTNENPLPPSPNVKKVLESFHPEVLRRYPPPTADGFRKIAAELHGIEVDNIIATRGGDELLRLVITTFVAPGESIGMTDPTYSLYPVLAQIHDCPIVQRPIFEDWALPIDFAREMNNEGVKLTLLVNPHAPSGALISLEEVSAIATELNSILLLDEAYIDFVDHPYPSPALITQHDNLIILRSLSKGYSLAGLRFGYGMAASSLIKPMITKTRDSYNLDNISQLIAEAALADQDYARTSWELVSSERARLAQSLNAMGLPSPPSQANFILVTVPDSAPLSAPHIYQNLKEKHILVRYFDSPGMQNKLRITIGDREDNRLLEAALSELML
jgi:histidinol-phosphate aminotransferase